ncbi:MAG: hypothetical protein ACOC3X_03580 [Nanoarchaeota archaeon]
MSLNCVLKDAKNCRKLTDFKIIKEIVLKNMVKNVPSTLKNKCNLENSFLSCYF